MSRHHPHARHRCLSIASPHTSTHPHIITSTHPHHQTVNHRTCNNSGNDSETTSPASFCTTTTVFPSFVVRRRSSSVVRHSSVGRLPTLARTSVSQQHRTPHTSTPAHHRRCDELLVTVKSVTIISLSLRLCCACGHLCPCLSDGCCSFKQWCGSW